MVFGCETVSAVIMQSSDVNITRNIVYAEDEQGANVAFAITTGGKCEASGEYYYRGSDIAAFIATVTVASPTGVGGLYVYELSRKTTNNGFQRGSFKAGGVEGVS